VTYAIIALNVAVFLYTVTLGTANPQPNTPAFNAAQAKKDSGICYGFDETAVDPPSLSAYYFSDVNAFYCRWAFQPREWFDTAKNESQTPQQSKTTVLVSIITAMFLHAGWLHIAGNMLFLWVFGDNVEDRLGHIGFAIFYLLAGIVATLTQGLIDPNSLVPVVGASGAIAGVLGAYLIYYPKAMVTTLIPIAIIFIPVPIPAVIVIGLWFVMNLLSGLAALSPSVGAADSGVAFFAHVGGFLFGAMAVLLFLRGVGKPRRESGRRAL
jgi:membrane associated rhomboid family serine protease